MQANGCTATHASGSASTMLADESTSQGARWTEHRSSREIDAPALPSTASTPAATPLPDQNDHEDAFTSHPMFPSNGVDVDGSSSASASASASASTSAFASAPSSRAGLLSVDAEDEDVKIAIMALGAMKSLDGKVSSSATRADASGWSTGPQVSSSYHKLHTETRSPPPTSSGLSASSVISTALSSPSSTPATDLTQESGAESPTGVSGRNGRGPATLADLPPDFQFPAVIQDEQGNEVRVDSEMLQDAAFLSRVSHLPIVRGTLRAYELGKQRSKVVKYGADFVESSVKSISRPVVSRLGASLGERGVEQLDDFACRQLDRLYPSSVQSPSREEKKRLVAELEEKEKTEWQHMGEEEREKRKKAYLALRMEEREREIMVNEIRQRKGKGREGSEASATAPASAPTSAGSTASQLSTDGNGIGDGDGDEHDRNQAAHALVRSQGNQPFGGSRWGSMLVEAGATAGGLSAAMSEESMKSLKYCLQWLQYATAHIEHQITILRDLIVKLNHGELDVSGSTIQNLSSIKGDVVNTIRGVVDVVGKYAGSALPEPARNSVKAFILSLPARWATVIRSPSVSSPSGYFSSSPSPSSFSPAHISSGPDSPAQSAAQRPIRGVNTPRDQMQAAGKILTLAVESLDILRSVTIVFGESLDRADLWVERLRILGLQRKRQHEQATNGCNRLGPGSLTAVPWESERGYSRASSPGGDSDASMGTTASTKRRRVRNSRIGASLSPNAPASQIMSRTPSVMSDDENLTETERGFAGPGSGRTAKGAAPLLTQHGATASPYSHGIATSGSSGGHVARRRTRAEPGSKHHTGNLAHGGGPHGTLLPLSPSTSTTVLAQGVVSPTTSSRMETD